MTKGARLGNMARPYRRSTIPTSLQPIMPFAAKLVLIAS